MTKGNNNTVVPDATSSSMATTQKIPQPAAVTQYVTKLPPSTTAHCLPDIPSSSSHIIGSADVTASSAVGLTSSSPTKKKTTARHHPLRRGKWTTEEEAYARRLINEFKSGLLPLTDGTTLRAFLSKLLNCDPMRLSKKFVGNNCIGKQVFRRRVVDFSRLSEEQLERMRCELSELERHFYDRVVQTNRVKAPGMTPLTSASASNPIMIVSKVENELENRPPTPPWLRPPKSYKAKGRFAEKEKLLAAAAAARSLRMGAIRPNEVPSLSVQQQQRQQISVSSTPPLVDTKSNTECTIAAIKRSNSSIGRVSSLDRLAEAAEMFPRSESALEQLARTASAAKFVEDIVNGDGSTSRGRTSHERSTLQVSFEALMNMDIGSVENLVELAANSNSSAILSELSKNYYNNLKNNQSSGNNMSSRMETFIKSLSSANLTKYGSSSQHALESLLHASSSNIFDAEKYSSRNGRVESSTGFSQLRAEGGLNTDGRHDSVQDFLSLVASGDIPHQDPNMLQVPLKVMTRAGSKRKLSQHQLAALATRLGSTNAVPGTDTTTKPKSSKKRRKNETLDCARGR